MIETHKNKESRVAGRAIARQLFPVIFVVAFFIVIVAILSSETLRHFESVVKTIITVNTSGWTNALETYYAMQNFILVISAIGLLSAIFVGLILSRKIIIDPLTHVEAHAEELTTLNKELNEKNKLLVEREIQLSETNKKLQELDETKTEFVSLVAHQLRTPLAGLKWTLDMLINGDVGETTPEQKSMLIKMSETNDNTAHFVNDLLSVSRIESGRLEYNFTPTNLEQVAESVLLDVYPVANKKRIEIILRSRGITLPDVAADKEKIRIVFQNVLENAVKYSPEGEKVVLDIRNRGEELLITVEDKGMGIPKEEQKSIFKKFYRAPSAIKAQTEGSGLGLYLAKAITEGHGGKLWYESDGGRGSIFYFTVPVPRKTS